MASCCWGLLTYSSFLHIGWDFLHMSFGFFDPDGKVSTKPALFSPPDPHSNESKRRGIMFWEKTVQCILLADSKEWFEWLSNCDFLFCALLCKPRMVLGSCATFHINFQQWYAFLYDLRSNNVIFAYIVGVCFVLLWSFNALCLLFTQNSMFSIPLFRFSMLCPPPVCSQLTGCLHWCWSATMFGVSSACMPHMPHCASQGFPLLWCCIFCMDFFMHPCIHSYWMLSSSDLLVSIWKLTVGFLCCSLYGFNFAVCEVSHSHRTGSEFSQWLTAISLHQNQNSGWFPPDSNCEKKSAEKAKNA